MQRFAVTVLAMGLATAGGLQILRAQAPAIAPPQMPGGLAGKVYLSGENPGITLREKSGSPVLASVSYWRVHWSPVGAGPVCYITTGDGSSASDVRVAIFDNQKLYELITNDIFKVFNESYRTRPFTPVPGGKFRSTGDSVTERSEYCDSDRYNVELSWRKLGAPTLISRDPGRPENPFGLVYLMIPSADAEIKVNGKKLPGSVFPTPQGTGGAILAFGETWRRLQ